MGWSGLSNVLELINVAGTRSFDQSELQLLGILIVDEYPDMTFGQLREAIMNGVKGKYNQEGNAPINSITLFRWLEQWHKDNPKQIGWLHTRDYLTDAPVKKPVYEGDVVPRLGFEKI